LKRTFTILLFPALVACLPSLAFAFSYETYFGTPIRWPSQQAVLTLHPDSFPVGNVFNNNAQFAMSDWNAVIGSNFLFFVNSFPCNWGNHSDGINCVIFASGLGGSTLGVTFLTSSGTNITDRDVWFNVNVSWVPGLDVGDFTIGPPYSFRGVARHEFGHALGLLHEDGLNNVVLMNSIYTAGGVRPANPHWDDRAGVRFLYPGLGGEIDLIPYMWKKISTSSQPVTPIPATANSGDSVTIEYSFENAGNVGSGSFNIGFYLSTDSIISTSDTLIGLNVGASAPAHSRGTFTRAVTIPANTPTGNYFIGVCLDIGGAVAESVESNNCARAPGTGEAGAAANPPVPISITLRHDLTVTKAGSGTGTVTSSPAGINCGVDCSEKYNHGTSVTLTASADSGSTFSGWSGGGCTGTGTCTVTMSANTTVKATFSKTFTDDPLTAQVTPVKVVHITELREGVNTLRSNNGLSTFSYTDPTLTAGATQVKVVHIAEARTALDGVYDAQSKTRPTYTDSTITAGQTAIKKAHIAEIRSNIKAVE